MKLRHLFIITFCLTVVIPMTLFWIWPYSKALDSEIKDVNERHLVIAKNISMAFERYYQDVTGIFSVIDTQSPKQLKTHELQMLLKSYHFELIILVDNKGLVKECLYNNPFSCPSKISNDVLTLAQYTMTNTGVALSSVTEDKIIGTGPILLVVKKKQDNLLLGYLSTRYIVQTGKKVAFGEKGHAAIVDQAGNVLAHPLDSWIKERKNISKISVVQKMLSGKTGVEEFYSPALKGNMIAGYTHVANANWGVMVPQPIKELENKAQAIDETAIFVMLLGLGLAFLVTIPLSFVLINPLENLSRAIKLIEKGESKVNLEWNLSKLIPCEIRELKKSFSKMMEKIEKNKTEISTLAYFDSSTGLPNRNFFYRLSSKALEKMAQKNQKGALIFIDFDGFKSVNDTYGHRIGDQLLYLFGQRLSTYLFPDNTHQKTLSFYEVLPDIIPARLGGDEFVLLFQNIQDKYSVEVKINEIFSEVFSEYKLSSDISLTLTGSAGVVLFPEQGEKYDELLKLADIAMYEAKSLGKNRVQFSTN